jgi:hypothetical protein
MVNTNQHGYPDYGNDPLALALQVTDLGELAARLGSPYNILRSGKVIYMDTFEDGITRWISSISGDGTVTQSTNKPYSGLNSLMITPSSTLNNFVGIYKYIPLVRYGVYGFDTLIHFNTDGVNSSPKFLGMFEINITPNFYQGSVTIDPNNGNVYVFANVNGNNTNVLVYTGIVNLIGRSVDNIYSYLHLSINTQTLHYKNLIINDVSIDLTQYALAQGTTNLVTSIDITFFTQSAGNQNSVQLDNVIIVIDEP